MNEFLRNNPEENRKKERYLFVFILGTERVIREGCNTQPPDHMKNNGSSPDGTMEFKVN